MYDVGREEYANGYVAAQLGFPFHACVVFLLPWWTEVVAPRLPAGEAVSANALPDCRIQVTVAAVVSWCLASGGGSTGEACAEGPCMYVLADERLKHPRNTGHHNRTSVVHTDGAVGTRCVGLGNLLCPGICGYRCRW